MSDKTNSEDEASSEEEQVTFRSLDSRCVRHVSNFSLFQVVRKATKTMNKSDKRRMNENSEDEQETVSEKVTLRNSFGNSEHNV